MELDHKGVNTVSVSCLDIMHRLNYVIVRSYVKRKHRRRKWMFIVLSFVDTKDSITSVMVVFNMKTEL
jgi:hypothetical protein